mmetsp:Transcript_50710/g.51098  ORF Transcript_50710/g.51098 Transcript_50710/m.51098 type:complete len:98 (+) Transcript_50710:146-439(+)
MLFMISRDDTVPIATCVLALITSLGSKTRDTGMAVTAPMTKGRNRSGVWLVPTVSGSSGAGKARLRASLKPKATAFSAAIPHAVGMAYMRHIHKNNE